MTHDEHTARQLRNIQNPGALAATLHTFRAEVEAGWVADYLESGLRPADFWTGEILKTLGELFEARRAHRDCLFGNYIGHVDWQTLTAASERMATLQRRLAVCSFGLMEATMPED